MQIGTVTALNRFPVKSMRAEPLQRAQLSWNGLFGDRQYAFVKTANRTRFPWLTGRDVFAMILHTAAYRDPEDPARSRVHVRTPKGWEGELDDPELTRQLSEAAGEPVHLIRLNT